MWNGNKNISNMVRIQMGVMWSVVQNGGGGQEGGFTLVVSCFLFGFLEEGVS